MLFMTQYSAFSSVYQIHIKSYSCQWNHQLLNELSDYDITCKNSRLCSWSDHSLHWKALQRLASCNLWISYSSTIWVFYSLLTKSRNAFKLIISILTLHHEKIVIVQILLVKIILSNILLILEMTFSAACIQSSSKAFNKTITQVSLSLISLYIETLLILTRCFPTLNSLCLKICC